MKIFGKPTTGRCKDAIRNTMLPTTYANMPRTPGSYPSVLQTFKPKGQTPSLGGCSQLFRSRAIRWITLSPSVANSTICHYLPVVGRQSLSSSFQGSDLYHLAGGLQRGRIMGWRNIHWRQRVLADFEPRQPTKRTVFRRAAMHMSHVTQGSECGSLLAGC